GYAREILGALGLGLIVPAALSAVLWWFLPEGIVRAILVPPVFGALALMLFWIALAPEERETARGLAGKIRRKLGGTRGDAA
ncbi:MAG TPA: hypothetical protein VM694_21330, partial [Polyangium sp.]|nr:hypothetical protein [Polyangium sp.]